MVSTSESTLRKSYPKAVLWSSNISSKYNHFDEIIGILAANASIIVPGIPSSARHVYPSGAYDLSWK